MGDKKSSRSMRVGSSKSPIAPPPRAAVSGRSHHHDDSASTKSTKSTPETIPSDGEDDHEALPYSNSEKEKDAKIAALQKELATMESEFERELTNLSHKENETSVFWQNKHSALHQTFLKLDTDLRTLMAEGEGRERDVNTRVSSLKLDRDAFREAYNEAMGELRGREELIEMLRGQVRGLKSWVSTNSRGEEQVSDEGFGEHMQNLGNGLQNWVISGFRRVKIDLEKSNDETKELLLHLVPTYESLATSSKAHLVQSLVARLLVERVFERYFVGLSKEHADDLSKVEKYLGNFGSAESMNQWRSSTLSILRKDATEKLQSETDVITESIVAQVNSIVSSISDIQSSESRDQSLRALITSSIDLSRLLRVQKAVFSIIMPSIEAHQKTMFDAESMEDIGGEDEDTLHEREIRCVTFPGIVKSGDENGERAHLRNIVAKVRVLCAPD